MSRRPSHASVPPLLREIVLRLFDYTCQHCKRRFAHVFTWEYLEMDHKIPVAHGGRTTLANLQPLCKACNGRKGAR